jgi:hypothetical protein
MLNGRNPSPGCFRECYEERHLLVVADVFFEVF